MTKPKYKLVIFDLDGTLINSVTDLAIATNYALQYFGLPIHTEDEYRYFVGNGVNLLLYRALPEEYKNDEWVQRMREIMLPYYSEHCTDKTAPYKGISSLLNRLCNSNIKIAVASNKYQAATTAMVKHYFPEIPFVATFGQRDGVPIKPDPAIVSEILSIADVDIKEVLYVGDTAVDMQTANRAGVTAVGVTWGVRPRAELEAEKPRFVVDTVTELERVIFD